MRKRLISSVVLGLAVLAAPALHAKSVIGVYGLIDRVVLEPNATEPQRAQIWGTFLLADRERPDAYLDAKRGYLYYACPTGKDAVCLSEWNELTSVAAKGTAIGFGSRFQSNGRVRLATEAVASPDAYPIQFGVARLGTDQVAQDLLARLKAGK
jgi:hypothetical protein